MDKEFQYLHWIGHDELWIAGCPVIGFRSWALSIASIQSIWPELSRITSWTDFLNCQSTFKDVPDIYRHHRGNWEIFSIQSLRKRFSNQPQDYLEIVDCLTQLTVLFYDKFQRTKIGKTANLHGITSGVWALQPIKVLRLMGTFFYLLSCNI